MPLSGQVSFPEIQPLISVKKVHLERADLTEVWRSTRFEPCLLGRRMEPAARARLDALRFRGFSGTKAKERSVRLASEIKASQEFQKYFS